VRCLRESGVLQETRGRFESASEGKGTDVNLFNEKTISKAIAALGSVDSSRQSAFASWAASIASGRIGELKETELHGPFMQKITIEGLGYKGPVGVGHYSVTQEQSIIQGSVDLALGSFGGTDRKVVAPFELKGANTINLDAIMPGRAKSPVDQTWEYATNNSGTKWVILSNYLEIRLYAYSEGRQFYERFDLARMGNAAEFAKAHLLLSAESLLGKRTAELLEDSKRENKDITDRLYSDYKELRNRLIDAISSGVDKVDRLAAISTGQLILDRILFMAFAEDTGLLPPRTIENAYRHSDPYNPRPVWHTFKSLFSAIDGGSARLEIPRYNGGLFLENDSIECPELPDSICEGFKRIAEYDFASEISVTVLGHIFEQSISDVEHLQAVALGQTPPSSKKGSAVSRKKRDGIVYTPDYIARFIVERTLGEHARQKLESLVTLHALKGSTAHDDPIKWKSRSAERAAWTAYRGYLSGLRIVDPSCGSGVFLVKAFDWLKAEIVRLNVKLAELSGSGHVGDLLDPDSEILSNNLFGVDVNEESIEIAKLSLWIKTARRGKVLDSLDNNLKVGDSLIEDSNYAYRRHGFEWRISFKEIFASGGFDIVLGNPPYVRMELLKLMKPWLETRYEVVSDRADLYAYFFKRGIKLLKKGGRMGYISSSSFFKTTSGAPLRDYLRREATLETIIEFGNHQVFEGVTTYPAILTMVAKKPEPDHLLRFFDAGIGGVDSLEQDFVERADTYPQKSLGRGSWELEGTQLALLRDKIMTVGFTLKDLVGAPILGVKTGRDEPFLISQSVAKQIIRKDQKAQSLIYDHLVGDDLERWYHERPDRKAIYIKKGEIDIRDYPSVLDWLIPFRQSLEARATSQRFYEWQQAQSRGKDSFTTPKIIYPLMSQGPKFSLDRSGSLTNQNTFVINSSDMFLLAILNSKVTWFCLSAIADSLRGGVWRLVLKSNFVSQVRIPPAGEKARGELTHLAGSAQDVAQNRYDVQQDVLHRINDLRPVGNSRALTTKLKQWWVLLDFNAFRHEIRKCFSVEIPLKERSEWEHLINESCDQVRSWDAELSRIEAEIDVLVFGLFRAC